MEKEYKILLVDEEYNQVRLDRYIRKFFPNFSQVMIEKSLRNKFISVNNLKANSNLRLNTGDIISIYAKIIPEREKPKQRTKSIKEEDIRLISDNIIYRDADLIIINKPAGLAVQGGSGIKLSVDSLMPHMLDTLETYERPIHKLVHRLDKETSGILVIALNNKIAADLADSFKNKKVNKKYLAILEGNIKVNNGTITSIIDNKQRNLQEDNAATIFRVLRRTNNATLVEFKPITGKKHQLRLHALELGHAIIGDDKYSPSSKENNLMLHAFEINLPYKGTILSLRAEPPAHFNQAIAKSFGSSYNVRTKT